MLARAAARSFRPRPRALGLASVARARHFTNNLDVKLPDLAKDDPPATEGGAKVPFVFDFWESKAQNAAAAAKAVADELAAANSLPKVMTAASPTTHPGGGPSSNAYEPVLDAVAETAEQAVAEAKGFWGGLAQDVGVPSAGALRQSLAKITAEDQAPPPPAKNRQLDEEDKKGLWILLGLVAGGWIAGGIFSPRKRKQAH